jgi:hypothetical protein
VQRQSEHRAARWIVINVKGSGTVFSPVYTAHR